MIGKPKLAGRADGRGAWAELSTVVLAQATPVIAERLPGEPLVEPAARPRSTSLASPSWGTAGRVTVATEEGARSTVVIAMMATTVTALSYKAALAYRR